MRWLAMFWLPAVVLPAYVHAQTVEDPEEGKTPRSEFVDHLLHGQTLLPDWGRKDLEENGLSFQLYYNAYVGANPRGGKNPDERDYSHSWDLFVTADTERLGLWSGGKVLMQAKQNHGRNVNPDVGALGDPIDDADFDELIYIDQLYYEHTLAEASLRFRVGYLDYQTIVDRNAFANSEDIQFMNTFLDNDPMIPLKIGFGASLWVDVCEALEFTLGAADAENVIREAGFDSAFGDLKNWMLYAEAHVRADLGDDASLPGNYRIGTFYDPLKRPRIAAGTPTYDKGSVGAYLSCDQLVLRENGEDEQGLGLFGRYGWRDPDVHRVAQFWSFGCHYLGPFEGRDQDALGLAMYEALPSTRFRNRIDGDARKELGVELFYRLQATPWLAISTSAQYQKDPGGTARAHDALTFVLRVRVRL